MAAWPAVAVLILFESPAPSGELAASPTAVGRNATGPDRLGGVGTRLLRGEDRQHGVAVLSSPLDNPANATGPLVVMFGTGTVGQFQAVAYPRPCFVKTRRTARILRPAGRRALPARATGPGASPRTCCS